MRLALFGGLYSNYLALDAAIRDADEQGAEELYCLGDFGAFGPHPDRVFPLLHEHNVTCIQGNYDHSIGNGLEDCQCGYTDPRDNYFAHISYRYTFDHTSQVHRDWMRDLPGCMELDREGRRLLLCHGSPRRTNEFLWESTTSTHFLDQLARQFDAELLLGTHTGLHYHRPLADNRHFVNVGVLGRPANDGTPLVWYTLLELIAGRPPRIEFRQVEYDHQRLADEMRGEGLPDEFVATIVTGWWTTCLEVLPSRERRRGRF